MSGASFGGIGFGGVSQPAISQISRGVATTTPKNDSKAEELVKKNDESAKENISRQDLETGRTLDLSA